MKLYKVTCRGMQSTLSGPAHGIAYVVAGNPTEAYSLLRKILDESDIGFRCDRELESIELLAQAGLYHDCKYSLIVKGRE